MEPGELETLIDQVLRQHGPALRLYAATWTRSPDDALQTALIKLAGTDPQPENVVGWMYRVVRNESISRARSEQRRRSRERRAASPAAVFESNVNDTFDQTELTAALNSLSSDVREVIVAKIWGQQTFEQIGELAGCSSSAAHRRYQNGLKQMQQIMVSNSKHEPRV